MGLVSQAGMTNHDGDSSVGSEGVGEHRGWAWGVFVMMCVVVRGGMYCVCGGGRIVFLSRWGQGQA